MVKQSCPPAYRKITGKLRGLQMAIKDKGFGVIKHMTKHERKALHNRGQRVLIRTLIKTVGRDTIRDGQNYGKTKDRARDYWSRLNPVQKNEFLLKVSKEVDPASPEGKALEFLTDGIEERPNRYVGKECRSAAERANKNCRFRSRAILVTYQSKKLVLATLDEWRGLSDTLLVERLKEDGDISRLVKIAALDVDALQTKMVAVEWSASLEVCMETWHKDHQCRLHLHFVAVRPQGFRYTDGTRTPALKLERLNIVPAHIKGCIDPANGKRSKSSGPLHYYLQMPKKGLIASWTNHFAYKDFLVSPRWIVSFVQRGKITHEDAKKVTVFFIFEGGPPPHTYTENPPFSPIPFFNIFWACLVHKMYSLLR